MQLSGISSKDRCAGFADRYGHERLSVAGAMCPCARQRFPVINTATTKMDVGAPWSGANSRTTHAKRIAKARLGEVQPQRSKIEALFKIPTHKMRCGILSFLTLRRQGYDSLTDGHHAFYECRGGMTNVTNDWRN